MDKSLEVAAFAAGSAMMATAVFNIITHLFIAPPTTGTQFAFALTMAFIGGLYRLSLFENNKNN